MPAGVLVAGLTASFAFGFTDGDWEHDYSFLGLVRTNGTGN